ncbi:MAG: hypothetical protein QGG71_20930 [Pirellulaceae bacterium]|jgi:hypothetical protein|nr:hypothetical protein [Pirellulaceae bacterium]
MAKRTRIRLTSTCGLVAVAFLLVAGRTSIGVAQVSQDVAKGTIVDPSGDVEDRSAPPELAWMTVQADDIGARQPTQHADTPKAGSLYEDWPEPPWWVTPLVEGTPEALRSGRNVAERMIKTPTSIPGKAQRALARQMRATGRVMLPRTEAAARLGNSVGVASNLGTASGMLGAAAGGDPVGIAQEFTNGYLYAQAAAYGAQAGGSLGGQLGLLVGPQGGFVGGVLGAGLGAISGAFAYHFTGRQLVDAIADSAWSQAGNGTAVRVLNHNMSLIQNAERAVQSGDLRSAQTNAQTAHDSLNRMRWILDDSGRGDEVRQWAGRAIGVLHRLDELSADRVPVDQRPPSQDDEIGRTIQLGSDQSFLARSAQTQHRQRRDSAGRTPRRNPQTRREEQLDYNSPGFRDHATQIDRWTLLGPEGASSVSDDRNQEATSSRKTRLSGSGTWSDFSHIKYKISPRGTHELTIDLANQSFESSFVIDTEYAGSIVAGRGIVVVGRATGSFKGNAKSGVLRGSGTLVPQRGRNFASPVAILIEGQLSNGRVSGTLTVDVWAFPPIAFSAPVD